MSLPPNLGPRNGILSLTIKDKSVLYAAYMPFVRNGGLFIPTAKSYKLGDEVFMLLNLMDEPEKIPVAGKVVWITPKGAQGSRAAAVTHRSQATSASMTWVTLWNSGLSSAGADSPSSSDARSVSLESRNRCKCRIAPRIRREEKYATVTAMKIVKLTIGRNWNWCRDPSRALAAVEAGV